MKDEVPRAINLVQRGGNKQPIANQRNAYAVFILTFECVTFDFRLAVLGA
jgi:hypothetical protein